MGSHRRENAAFKQAEEKGEKCYPVMLANLDTLKYVPISFHFRFLNIKFFNFADNEKSACR